MLQGVAWQIGYDPYQAVQLVYFPWYPHTSIALSCNSAACWRTIISHRLRSWSATNVHEFMMTCNIPLHGTPERHAATLYYTTTFHTNIHFYFKSPAVFESLQSLTISLTLSWWSLPSDFVDEFQNGFVWKLCWIDQVATSCQSTILGRSGRLLLVVYAL